MKTQVSNSAFRKLTYSAMCLALCLVLPFLTGQIPQIGSALCPMHLPVLLAGYLCGPGGPWGWVLPRRCCGIFGCPCRLWSPHWA